MLRSRGFRSRCIASNANLALPARRPAFPGCPLPDEFFESKRFNTGCQGIHPNWVNIFLTTIKLPSQRAAGRAIYLTFISFLNPSDQNGVAQASFTGGLQWRARRPARPKEALLQWIRQSSGKLQARAARPVTAAAVRPPAVVSRREPDHRSRSLPVESMTFRLRNTVGLPALSVGGLSQ